MNLNRIRLLAVLGCLVVSVLLNNVSLLLAVIVTVLAVLWWSGVSLKQIGKRYLLLVPFALGTVVLLPFTVENGVERATLIFLKISAANFLLTYLLSTVQPLELIKQLRSLGMPALLVMIIQMMLRYFYLLAEEARTMLRAQRSRGLRTDSWFWSRAVYRRVGELLGVLFIRANVRSQNIYMAMESRGGIGEIERPAFQQRTSQEVSRVAVELSNVSYHYGELEALRNVSFCLQRGSKTALIGHNGAGKSTLIALMNGLAVPSSGEVSLFGEPLHAGNRMFARQRVGVVYQDPDDQIFSPTVEEDVAFGPRNLGLSEAEINERVERALASAGLRDVRKRSPFELSYGQKRRVAIAGVLAMQPEVIIMDEPMAFLDPKGREELQALLESLHLMGITLMVATHDMDFAAEWADRVLILQQGSVYTEGLSELLFDEAILNGAGLPLPRLAQPFRLLRNMPADIKPRSVREAAQWIWRLMMRRETEHCSIVDSGGEEHGKTGTERD